LVIVTRAKYSNILQIAIIPMTHPNASKIFLLFFGWGGGEEKPDFADTKMCATAEPIRRKGELHGLLCILIFFGLNHLKQRYIEIILEVQATCGYHRMAPKILLTGRVLLMAIRFRPTSVLLFSFGDL
jgi:hypothetical protein